ncbi:MAG: 2Fe-2S iron-sulfur cluster-binding protein [Deltaproteobacteria bacterium]|nr:2Fe-2S iron-sulfur cluster-binding protein [Deltaproteobacteria bacterium]
MHRKKIPLNIDGKDIEAASGQPILEVARKQGVFIPTLCHRARTGNAGACRICVVEVENPFSGRRLLHAGQSLHGHPATTATSTARWTA